MHPPVQGQRSLHGGERTNQFGRWSPARPRRYLRSTKKTALRKGPALTNRPLPFASAIGPMFNLPLSILKLPLQAWSYCIPNQGPCKVACASTSYHRLSCSSPRQIAILRGTVPSECLRTACTVYCAPCSFTAAFAVLVCHLDTLR